MNTLFSLSSTTVIQYGSPGHVFSTLTKTLLFFSWWFRGVCRVSRLSPTFGLCPEHEPAFTWGFIIGHFKPYTGSHTSRPDHTICHLRGPSSELYIKNIWFPHHLMTRRLAGGGRLLRFSLPPLQGRPDDRTKQIRIQCGNGESVLFSCIVVLDHQVKGLLGYGIQRPNILIWLGNINSVAFGVALSDVPLIPTSQGHPPRYSTVLREPMSLWECPVEIARPTSWHR